MIDIEITSREIGTNSTTVITDTENRILYESNGSGYDVFVAFSASSVCTVDLSIEDDFEDYGTYSVERLTNPHNTIPNLYALHLTLDNYTYFPGDDEPSARDINFGIGVHTCNFGYGDSEFSISQSGCPMCHVTFNWGAYSTPGNNKNYTVDYYAGDNIDDADIRYGIEDLITEGLGWDGKFYYDQEFTNEVIFDCDTVERDVTIYANVFQSIKFNVKDGKTEAYLDSINITVNDSPTILAYCQDCEYKYIIPKPFEDTAEEFTTTISKEGYITRTITYSFDTLNEHTIFLEKDRGNSTFYATFQWGARVDFDPFIQIFDSDMNPLMEDDVPEFNSKPAHLYYGHNNLSGIDDESDVYHFIQKSWVENSGYGDWLSEHGRTDKAYAVLKCDGKFYEHDYDYTGGSEREPMEHMTGEVDLNGSRVYRIALNVCNSSKGGLADLNGTVTITFNNTEKTYTATANTKYWTVCEIKKVNDEWIINDINNYSNTAPSGHICCPSPGIDMVMSTITSWINGGTITTTAPLELTYQSHLNGYNVKFIPPEDGTYVIKSYTTEGAGAPAIRIINPTGGTLVNSYADDYISSRFSASGSSEYNIKIAFWSAGVGAGKIRTFINKEPEANDIFNSVTSWVNFGDAEIGMENKFNFTSGPIGYKVVVTPETGERYNVNLYITKGLCRCYYAIFNESDEMISDVEYCEGDGGTGFSADDSSLYTIKMVFWSPETVTGNITIIPTHED